MSGRLATSVSAMRSWRSSPRTASATHSGRTYIGSKASVRQNRLRIGKGLHELIGGQLQRCLQIGSTEISGAKLRPAEASPGQYGAVEIAAADASLAEVAMLQAGVAEDAFLHIRFAEIRTTQVGIQEARM